MRTVKVNDLTYSGLLTDRNYARFSPILAGSKRFVLTWRVAENLLGITDHHRTLHVGKTSSAYTEEELSYYVNLLNLKAVEGFLGS